MNGMIPAGLDGCSKERRAEGEKIKEQDGWMNGMNSFGVWMNSMKKTGAENLMGDEILERNKNLNRGFRKLRVMNPFGNG